MRHSLMACSVCRSSMYPCSDLKFNQYYFL